MRDTFHLRNVQRAAAEWGDAVDLARAFADCWKYEGPLDQVEEWARQLREELERVLGADIRTEGRRMNLVTCPNCRGRDSSRWPGGPCTICHGTGKTTPDQAALVRANAKAAAAGSEGSDG